VEGRCAPGFGPVRSVGYEFREGDFRKRDLEEGRCTSFQKADVLGLSDGTRYNITDMGEATVAELVGHVKGLVGKPYISATFDEYQI
jgi:hypothetical protein